MENKLTFSETQELNELLKSFIQRNNIKGNVEITFNEFGFSEIDESEDLKDKIKELENDLDTAKEDRDYWEKESKSYEAQVDKLEEKLENIKDLVQVALDEFDE